MINEKLKNCIDICNLCANINDVCALDCENEEHLIPYTKCIELNNYTAEVCRLTAALIHNGNAGPDIYSFCVKVCNTCADECEKHVKDSCMRSARMCRACAELCNDLLPLSNAA